MNVLSASVRRLPERVVSAAAFALLGLIPVNALGVTIFDNGGPDFKNGQVSDFDAEATFTQMGDDFSLAPGQNTIRAVRWFGGYVGSPAYVADDDFTIRIFEDESDAPPTTPLHTATIGPVARVSTGGQSASLPFDVYEYRVAIDPVTVASNTIFWLSIVNNTTENSGGDSEWFWASSDESETAVARPADDRRWSVGVTELAFSLLDDDRIGVIPEPSTLAIWSLLGALAIIVGWWRKRRAA